LSQKSFAPKTSGDPNGVEAMNEKKTPAPKPANENGGAALSPHKLAEKQRLAEALRENLRRRKAQVRGRKADPNGEAGS
jgi:hypothetical protein